MPLFEIYPGPVLTHWPLGVVIIPEHMLQIKFMNISLEIPLI